MDDDIAENVVWERDQLKQRNQELLRQMEGDRAAYQKDIDAYMKDVDDMARQRDLFEERISKAREILTHSMSESREYLLLQMGKAIDALEGKDEFPCPHCQKMIRLNTLHECIVIPEDLEALEGK